jgi:hypothetical protein
MIASYTLMNIESLLNGCGNNSSRDISYDFSDGENKMVVHPTIIAPLYEGPIDYILLRVSDYIAGVKYKRIINRP